ncbi:oleate hydratase [Halopseudomonas nanhaiensis]|uniref:hydroxysqualene dehydroxylase n=1 Tax=Halopseudomonas nanhaiensis TaxID=2830842 RepID=UPI001CBEF223|nr:FAD-dependent oxidoreductase [Halopseudomonas nanhaiensis]UAW97282.1 oleate hydratase [Halopseudomonas nanhaiensis]
MADHADTGMPEVLIVGAGLAGLSCGAFLADAGLRVEVLESSSVAGGRARSWSDPGTGYAVDIGPHVLLSKYPNMLALLERLGSAEQICWQTDHLLTVLDDRRPIRFKQALLPPPLHYLNNLGRVLPTVPLGRLLSNIPITLRTMGSSPSDILDLDDRTGIAHLHANGVSQPFIDWFWASVSMAFLNLPVEQCSAASLMRIFWQALGHNDVTFGFPKVGLSELYVPQAIERIERAGGCVRYDQRVTGVSGSPDRPDGVRLGDGSSRHADQVILAVPPTAIPTLLPASQRLVQVARQFEPSPYISCYLWFDRKLTDARFWARPWSSKEFNTDFYDLSNIRETGTGPGSMIATNIIWSHRAKGMSDEAVIQATINEISDFAPEVRRAQLIGSAVHRIPMSVPCARPGIERLRPATTAVQGLYLAGDWTDTGLPFCMESAVRSAALAAEAVLTARGRTQQLALPVPTPGGLMRLTSRRL